MAKRRKRAKTTNTRNEAADAEESMLTDDDEEEMQEKEMGKNNPMMNTTYQMEADQGLANDAYVTDNEDGKSAPPPASTIVSMLENRHREVSRQMEGPDSETTGGGIGDELKAVRQAIGEQIGKSSSSSSSSSNVADKPLSPLLSDAIKPLSTATAAPATTDMKLDLSLTGNELPTATMTQTLPSALGASQSSTIKDKIRRIQVCTLT